MQILGTKTVWLLLGLVVSVALVPTSTLAQQSCEYMAPGNLIPGSGKGARVYDDYGAMDKIVSPIGGGFPAIAKTQVYAPGGGNGLSDECAASNFIMPHRDNYCEKRNGKPRDTVFGCPDNGIKKLHEGIDINAGDADDCYRLRIAQKEIRNRGSFDRLKLIPLVAVSDGWISKIEPKAKPYWISLNSRTNHRYNYLHINLETLLVKLGDRVNKGQTIGYYYDDFWPASWTPFHLHFEVNTIVDQKQGNYSPYMTFIKAVERTSGEKCKLVK